jgi:CO/xanthine dehydrogenase FAD-binding subunit
VYLRPRTLTEAVSALADVDAQILAGGTDFFPGLRDQLPKKPIVDISGLSELRGISADPEYFRIGGLTSWMEIIHAPLPRCFDALKAAAREIGSVQIQNRGTIAGNLCNASPAADGVPPLLALDADVELVTRHGQRRLPLGDFIVGNRKTMLRSGELVSAVLVRRRFESAVSTFSKLGARRYLVISITMLAVVLAVDDSRRVSLARIAVGSCSARPQRLHELESALLGCPVVGGLGSTVSASHLACLSPIDDVRAVASYRMDASLTLARRALDECARRC